MRFERALVCLASGGREGKSPHFVADVISQMRASFDACDALAYQRDPFELTLAVRGTPTDDERLVVTAQAIPSADGVWMKMTASGRRPFYVDVQREVRVPCVAAHDSPLSIAAVFDKNWLDTWPRAQRDFCPTSPALMPHDLGQATVTYLKRHFDVDDVVYVRTSLLPFWSEAAFVSSVTELCASKA